MTSILAVLMIPKLLSLKSGSPETPTCPSNRRLRDRERETQRITKRKAADKAAWCFDAMWIVVHEPNAQVRKAHSRRYAPPSRPWDASFAILWSTGSTEDVRRNHASNNTSALGLIQDEFLLSLS